MENENKQYLIPNAQHYHGISFEHNSQNWYLEKSYHSILNREGYQIRLINSKENIAVVLDNFVNQSINVKDYMKKAIKFIDTHMQTEKQNSELEKKLG